MSEKDIDRFDSLVRETLEDASEPVPESVWEGVSSRLGKRVLWRRVAISTAAAAAAAGVFFAGTRNSTNNNTIDIVAETQAPDVDSEPVVQTLLADIPETEIPGKDEMSSRRVPVTAIKEAAPATDVRETAGDAVEETGETPGDVAVSGEEVSEAAVTTQETENPGDEKVEETDEFAAMAFEDSRKEQKRQSRGFSVTASGNMMTNGDAKSPGSFHIMRTQGKGSGTSIRRYDNGSDTYSVPLTFGVGLRYSFAPRWSVGTGVTYSLLERTFSGQYSRMENGVETRAYNGDIRNTLHYIGIPLDLYYDIINSHRLKVYGFAGGAVEKALRNSYRMLDSDPFTYRESVDGVQWSVGAGVGIAYMLSDHVGLFVDPSLRYYFDCDQPVSIRTQQNLMMGFEIGLRFDL